MAGALHKLTASQAKALLKPGRHSDGGGLQLRIRPSGSKSWVFNYRDNGRRRDYGLGGYDKLTLAQAREKASECRSALASGETLAKAFQKQMSMTFAEASAQYVELRKSDWRSEKTIYRWEMFLQRYGSSLMPMDCKDIRREDVETALRPHWVRINHSARYFRNMIETVLDYATVKGWREGDNPARWKGNLEYVLARKKPPVKHNRAVSIEDAPKLYRELVVMKTSGSQCAAFALLTAARNGEARNVTAEQIDWKQGVWNVPAVLMKRGVDHAVPLSLQAIGLLKQQPLEADLMFPGLRNRVMSDNTVRKAVRSAGFPEATAHGMRSTFRDWCGETGAPRELAELALSHAVGNETERAYRRLTALERRRTLMQDWADYLSGDSA